MMVSENPASEDGNLEKRLRGGKPLSRSGRSRMLGRFPFEFNNRFDGGRRISFRPYRMEENRI